MTHHAKQISEADHQRGCPARKHRRAGLWTIHRSRHQARLKDKPLYLRGFWGDSKLHFMADGTLIGNSDPMSFTVAGFEFKSAHIGKDKLTLQGRRFGLEFTQNVPKAADLEGLKIQISAPADGDYGPALNAIFSDDLGFLVPSLPTYWQEFFQCYPVTPTDLAKRPASCPRPNDMKSSKKKLASEVSAPQLEEHVEAQFSRYARKAKYSGTCVVSLVVDRTGLPTHLKVLKPVGLGLDEQAMLAVQRWRFKPAMQDGNPVSVEVDIEVNFRIL